MESSDRKRYGYCFVRPALILVACAVGLGASAQTGPATSSKPAILRMATTTSTEATGLLDDLLPAFKQKSGIEVQSIAVGTGKALKLGEAGDVDVVLVHARAAEDKFVADGFGVNRRDVMWNDFVLLGPPADPAGVRGMSDAAAALKKIAAAKAVFVSRGDRSGTHDKELELWAAAGVQPGGERYLSTGQGMGETLTMANEKLGYTLSDRGTFFAFEPKIELVVLCEGDARLKNPYGVIAVNPARFPQTRYDAAMAFIDWLTSPEGQQRIASFKKNGKQLFYPATTSTQGR